MGDSKPRVFLNSLYEKIKPKIVLKFWNGFYAKPEIPDIKYSPEVVSFALITQNTQNTETQNTETYLYTLNSDTILVENQTETPPAKKKQLKQFIYEAIFARKNNYYINSLEFIIETKMVCGEVELRNITFKFRCVLFSLC